MYCLLFFFKFFFFRASNLTKVSNTRMSSHFPSARCIVSLRSKANFAIFRARKKSWKTAKNANKSKKCTKERGQLRNHKTEKGIFFDQTRACARLLARKLINRWQATSDRAKSRVLFYACYLLRGLSLCLRDTALVVNQYTSLCVFSIQEITHNQRKSISLTGEICTGWKEKFSVAVTDEFYTFDLMEMKNLQQNWLWFWTSRSKFFLFFCIVFHSSRGWNFFKVAI